MQTRPIHLAAVFALAVASTGAMAQTNTTALSGTVTDPSGAVLAGVPVTLTDTDSGAVKSTVTKSKGEYSFEQVAPGNYKVDVKAGNGFSEREEDVQLLVATPLSLNFKLTVGTSEIVNVESSISALNETDATLGKAFDSQQIQTLPYLANNITYLLSLQPGVLGLDSGAKTGGVNNDIRTGIVNGARQDQTNITLDGVDNNDQTNGYAFNGALRATRESVEEFRVTTTNANADAGRSSGGQVSLVTRAGTNALHGSAYEYYRSSIGAQNDWFTKQTQSLTGKNVPLKILENTYGASLGLPIKKDKLFFFGAYEAFKQASDQNVIQIVPSTPGGGGLVTGTVTYGACATGATTACATPVSYKTLTAPEIASLDPKCSANGTCPNGPGVDAATLAYFKSFPLANGTGSTSDGYNTGTYSFSSPVPLHQVTNIARLDYTINSRQTVFVRGNLQSDNLATALQFPGNPPPQNVFSNNKGIAAGHIWSIRDSITNNFRYGLIRQGSANRGSASQPYVTFLGLSSITATGTSATTQVYLVTTHNFADDFTLTKGRHTIQAGFNDRLLFNQRYFDSPLLANSSVSPNLLGAAAIANTGSSLDPSAFTCADCGFVANSFRTFYNQAVLDSTGVIEAAQSGTEYRVQGGALVASATVPTHLYHSLEQEYYIQDQWKATPRLTLTAGVRYVYLGVPYEVNGQEIAPTIGLGTFLTDRAAAQAQGNTYGTPITFRTAGSANGQPNFWTPQKLNFAPKFAFAYSTRDNKTSIRGGFALAYDHIGEGIIDNYESTAGSLLSLSKINKFAFPSIDTNPRFTGYHDLTPGTTSVSAPTLQLPYAPPNNPFTFVSSINNNIQTPYAETFNLTLQQDMGHNLTMTLSYVGRLGRHELQELDVAQPLNLYDPISATSYFQAATVFDKLYDAGTPVSAVPDSGYFHNIFPNAVYTPKGSATSYHGAQAYYAALAAGNRGNETNPLFACDTLLPGFGISNLTCGNAASPTFRFFFPQTSSIFAQSTTGLSSYNALQASIRQSLRYGVVYDVNYTWSKSLDEGSSPERSASNVLNNTFNPRGVFAPSDFDARHNITADYVLPFPVGRNAPFLSHSNKLVDELIGGWQLNGVVHFSGAFPFSANASGNYGTNFDVPSYFVQTGPIATGGHHFVPASGSQTSYETALKGITSTQAFSNLRYAYAGEVGQRNNFRADSYFSMDNGVSKSFHTFESQAFILKAEVFNVTGSPHFNALTTNGASTSFGKYSSLLTNPRQMQFSGKYTF